MNSQDQMWRDVHTASAGGRDWTALALLALPTLVATLDLGVLFLALPALTEDLRACATQHSEPVGSGVVRTRYTLAARSVQRINYAS